MKPSLVLTLITLAAYIRFGGLIHALKLSGAHSSLAAAPKYLSLPDVGLVIFFFLVRGVWVKVLAVLGYGGGGGGGGEAGGNDKSKDEIKNEDALATSSDETKPPNPETEIPSPNISLSSPLNLTSHDLELYLSSLLGPSFHHRKLPWSPHHTLLFLTATSSPTLLLLLAKRGCPINPLGAVNVRNRFELLRSDLCEVGERGMRGGGGMRARARVVRGGRVRRGVEWVCEVGVWVPEEGEGGREVEVFRQEVTLLEFGKGTGEKSESKKASATESKAEAESTEEPQEGKADPFPIFMDKNDPSSWAAICKDYNPIHMSNFVAKMFGFPGKIAHGNHVVARAVEALGGEALEGGKGLWMEVEFRRPVVLPAKLEVEVEEVGRRFSVVREGGERKVCVEGRWGEL
ncbi:Thioesterase/thiol ester dehydrase-isomerase [Aulographum hederae CBS 113979]|uniref:Thioesterase/thiol ester dehydrase-isomerase n=1 Tax=Aulographum hederae CBS 113979 TaxID=1176131 RepID=A0A6G1HDW4_9PEZI|nr:Thioesterase/thiol ester dehydrase-isomerase [Aulographum hederae CBS 113979]